MLLPQVATRFHRTGTYVRITQLLAQLAGNASPRAELTRVVQEVNALLQYVRTHSDGVSARLLLSVKFIHAARSSGIDLT